MSASGDVGGTQKGFWPELAEKIKAFFGVGERHKLSPVLEREIRQLAKDGIAASGFHEEMEKYWASGPEERLKMKADCRKRLAEREANFLGQDISRSR